MPLSHLPTSTSLVVTATLSPAAIFFLAHFWADGMDEHKDVQVVVVNRKFVSLLQMGTEVNSNLKQSESLLDLPRE